MLKIIFTEEIKAPKSIVWELITKTKDYPLWNEFIRECHTTFQVGTPITMKVQLFPFLAIWQKETIWQFEKGKLIDYGIKYPLGLLSSSRKHVLIELGKQTTRYESIFILKGTLAPIVQLFLGKQLRQGFHKMTKGILIESNKRLEGINSEKK